MSRWKNDLTSQQWSVLPTLSSSWFELHSTALCCCRGSSRLDPPVRARIVSPWTLSQSSTKSRLAEHVRKRFVDETCKIYRDLECAKSVRRLSVLSANSGTDIHPETRLKSEIHTVLLTSLYLIKSVKHTHTHPPITFTFTFFSNKQNKFYVCV